MGMIIMGDAEVLLYKEWRTHHPNISDGPPTCEHERGVYRDKNGVLFAIKVDDIGYGRNRKGVAGTYYRTHKQIEALDGPREAVAWCEHQGCFDVADIKRHFSDVLDEA